MTYTGCFDDSVLTSFLPTKFTFSSKLAQQKSPTGFHRAFVQSDQNNFPKNLLSIESDASITQFIRIRPFENTWGIHVRCKFRKDLRRTFARVSSFALNPLTGSLVDIPSSQKLMDEYSTHLVCTTVGVRFFLLFFRIISLSR